jgi:hypothetical protein
MEITASVYSSQLGEAVRSHPLEAKVQQSSIISRETRNLYKCKAPLGVARM